MRYGMIDLLFAVACLSAGMIIGSHFTSFLPKGFRTVVAISAGLGVYLTLIYPFYRGLRLFPMILPRCPCCRTFQPAFRILGGEYPCIRFECPGCNGEFIIWFNGQAGDQEDWERPVLVLKWPYALGRYCKATKPERADARERRSQADA